MERGTWINAGRHPDCASLQAARAGETGPESSRDTGAESRPAQQVGQPSTITKLARKTSLNTNYYRWCHAGRDAAHQDLGSKARTSVPLALSRSPEGYLRVEQAPLAGRITVTSWATVPRFLACSRPS